MKHITRIAKGEQQRTMMTLFDSLCTSRTRWQVWSDMVYMFAASISNAVDQSNAKSREAQYRSITKDYTKRQLETIAQIFAEIVMELDDNPDQDLLGELFMALELGNSHNGQFFTPYSVCRCMAAMSNEDIKGRIEHDGWISVNDPACGAGALLVAFANECRRPGMDINFQTSVLFVAQDIDITAGLMCYIQLSLLGCPGYVAIANTLTNPCTALDRRSLLPKPGEHIWYTPFYFREEWHLRRMVAMMDMLISSPVNCSEPEAEKLIAPLMTAPEAQVDKFGQLTLF